MQNMTVLLGRGAKGRKESLKVLGTMLFAAGAGGLPGSEDAEKIAEVIHEGLQKNRKDINYSLELKKLLEEMDMPADYIMHGVARDGLGLGMLARSVGLPMPRVDLSGSLALGRVFPFDLPQTIKDNVGYQATGS